VKTKGNGAEKTAAWGENQKARSVDDTPKPRCTTPFRSLQRRNDGVHQQKKKKKGTTINTSYKGLIRWRSKSQNGRAIGELMLEKTTTGFKKGAQQEDELRAAS